jgi:predicted N-acetyltransferase YhbS
LIIRKATREDLPTLFANVHDSWPHDPDPQRHTRLRLASNQHQRATWYLMEIESEIVSSLGCYPFSYRIHGNVLEGVGIGAVHSKSNWRNQGLAAKLISEVHEQIRLEERRLCHLYSDINPRYYSRLGYHQVPWVRVELARDSIAPAQLQTPITPASDPKASRALRQALVKHDRISRGWRSEADWQWLDQRHPHQQTYWLGPADDPSGYVTYSLFEGDYYLVDHVLPESWSWPETKATITATAFLDNQQDIVNAWFPRSYVGDAPEARPMQREIPMIQDLAQKLTTDDLDSLWWFPYEHV